MLHRSTPLLLAIAVSGLLVSPLAAQAPSKSASAPASTAQQFEALRKQNAEMLEELKAIRAALERVAARGDAGSGAAAPPSGPVTLGALPTDYVLGKADAPLTLVEFTDLQCPFCRQFHVTAFEEIKKAYIDTGKVRFISRDLPLEGLHPMAMPAARASRCAARQKKGWELRHAILVNNASLEIGSFATMAADLGLDMAAFAACTTDLPKLDAAIRKDMADASAARIDGTPGFVLGPTRAEGIEGTVISGALPFAEFDRQIKALLTPSGQ